MTKPLLCVKYEAGYLNLTFVFDFCIQVWAMERIAVESHFPGLCLQSKTVLRQQTNIHSSWSSADHRHVVVRCMWDNPRLHEEVGLPMYVLWQQDDQHSSLISALLTDRTTVSRPYVTFNNTIH